MWRLIFLGLIIWLIFSLLRRALQQRNQQKDDRKDGTTEINPSTHATEDMVQCCHCAVHLPRSEAFLVNGKIYCSKDHIQAS